MSRKTRHKSSNIDHESAWSTQKHAMLELERLRCGVQDAFDAAQVSRPKQPGPSTPDRRASGDQPQSSRRRDARGGTPEASAPRPTSAAQSPRQPSAVTTQPGTPSAPNFAHRQASSALPDVGHAVERQPGQRREGRPREDRPAKGESRDLPSRLPAIWSCAMRCSNACMALLNALYVRNNAYTALVQSRSPSTNLSSQ